MKEILKFFGLLIIPTIMILLLLVINTYLIQKVEKDWIRVIIFIIMPIFLWGWGYIIHQTPLNLNKTPKVGKEIALLFYALFIGSFAASFNIFFNYKLEKVLNNTLELKIFYPLLLIILAILFFIISYSTYYRKEDGNFKDDRDIANDFLLSISAALIVGIMTVVIGDKFKWDCTHLCSFNMIMSIGFIFSSLFVVFINIKFSTNKNKEGNN